MHNNTQIIAILCIPFLFLIACTNQLEAQPMSTPEAPAVLEAPVQTAPQPTQEPSMTAAEALKELQQTPAPAPTAKQASSLYPPAPGNVTGINALKVRTHALYAESQNVSTIQGGTTTSFPDYTKKSNLPPGYGNDASAGDS